MKNKSTLAKLLSEEDINVVHKQMETAYFDSKKRELGLPIWKDEEMTKDIYDLMVCHEIGHALHTPLDMLERARIRRINHSFVNVIEDARIEKKVKIKYPGSIGVFIRGYKDLVAKDFFGTGSKDIKTFNLIDRINVYFKSNDKNIPFSDEEKVWVDRVAAVNTEDEVLDLAEELYKWMEENAPEETGEGDEGDSDNAEDNNSDNGDGALGVPNDESDTGDDNSTVESGDEGDEDDGDTADGSDGDDTDDGDDAKDGSGSTDKGEVDTSDRSEVGEDTTKETTPEGGVETTGKGGAPVVETDSAFGKAMDEMRDKLASDRVYAKIPKTNPNDLIVGYKTCHEEFYGHFVEGNKKENGLYFSSTLDEVVTLKEESKKTVAYMVKEFEMKKAADQYARAAVSKTGSLDMGRLHTYKYNEDLFKKVTTLPGATNHGMVIVLDWSGSMADNLMGTFAQLFNLIWFCRKVKIPFEVFAFSDVYDRTSRYESYKSETYENFKCGEISLRPFKLLNFFSSSMTTKEETEMMHALYMYGSRWGQYRDWKTKGYPLDFAYKYNMGGTPLNDAIIAMMDIVPKFKSETGVQKVNTIFLTDGASNSLNGVYDYGLITDGDNKGDHYETITSFGYGRKSAVITDPVVNKTYELKNHTNDLLTILKNRVDGMNVIGFFIAGRGKSGKVDKRTIASIVEKSPCDCMDEVRFINKNKYLAVKEAGYDEYYILPGGNSLKVENEGLDDELIGASKAKLKSAFGKSMKGKIESRQLLNKFVKLVA